MKGNKLIHELHREMETMQCDVKLEVLLALAVKSGLQIEDFCITYDKFFYRAYSNDIFVSEIIEDALTGSFLQVHASRLGLYDQFPEGLFFQPDKTKVQVFDASIKADEYKSNKKKEQEIRRFFMPFEGEISLRLLQLEIEEARLLQGFDSGISNDYFISFWGLPPHLPKSLVIPLIRLLPYAHNVAGNPDLTARSLQIILNEKVGVKKLCEWNTPEMDRTYGLGEQLLGVDMVSGGGFEEDHTVMEFTIGPLKNSAVTDYLQGGSIEEFLRTFYGFFVPAGAEVTTIINVATESKQMILQNEEEPILGYTCIL